FYYLPCLHISLGKRYAGPSQTKYLPGLFDSGPSLAQLGKPLRAFSLLNQRLPSELSPHTHPLGKALFGGERDEGFAPLSGNLRFSTMGIEHADKPQGKGLAKRARQVVTQSHCLLAPLPRLVWIAEQP